MGIFFHFMVLSLFFSTEASAQQISLDFKGEKMITVLQEIQKQSSYNFIYNNTLVDVNQVVNISVSNAPINQVLDRLFSGTSIAYRIIDKQITIFPKEFNETQQQKPASIPRVVSGTVVDDKGEPLVGVSILNETNKKAAVSHLDGRFSIEAKEGDQLTFVLLGMENLVVTVGKQNLENIVLKTDNQVLEGAIVTGYQTISRERATGSYSIVNAKVLEQKPTANIASALTGLVPGLQVKSAPVDGQTRYIIRGQGTLQSNQSDRDPLIVVDGFAINGYSSSGTVSDPINDIKDPFATINPNDVESITVLKDAAATSIYGARAANGVIVITTKRGKDMNKISVSIDATVSISEKADIDQYFNMASAASQFRYMELVNKYMPLNLSSTADPYLDKKAHKTQYISEAYRLIFERDQKANISDAEYASAKAALIAQDGMWMRDLDNFVLRNTVRRQYNVAVRSASEKVNNSLSFGYNAEEGYLQGNGSNRVLINLMNSTKLTRKLTFNSNIVTLFSKRLNNGISLSSMKNYLSPWSRLVDEKGNFVHVPTSNTVYEPILRTEYANMDWDYNPIADRDYMNQHSTNVTMRVSGGLDYVTDWGLKLSAKGQYERRLFNAKTSYEPQSYYVRDLVNTYPNFIKGGIFSQSGDDYSGYNLRFQAEYSKTFADKHQFTALAGTEVISATTELIPSVTRYGFNKYTNSVVREIDYVTNLDDIFGNTGSKSTNPYVAPGELNTYSERFFSVYANLAYTYANRYSLTASFRTDASNYQAIDVRQKFSPFWSVGAGWIISNEEFMEGSDNVNLLKLRASYGIAGVAAGKSETSSVTTLATSAGIAARNYGESYSYVPSDQRGNTSLTWEKSRTLNVGVDYGFFGNKLFGSVDFYNRYSYDVLSPATVPVICQGITKATFNNAEVLNRGAEVSVGTYLRIAEGLNWNGMLNYSYNSNKVTKFLVTSDFNATTPDYIEGYPISFVLGLIPSGYTPVGQVILQGKDGTTETITNKATAHYQEILSRKDGDPIAANNWIYYMGSRTPKHELSFSNSFSYKGVTLSFMITGRFGYVFRKGGQLGHTYYFASFSKELENSFEVYDKGYGNQSGYSAYPLFNDANYPLFNTDQAYYYMSMVRDMFSNNILPGAHIRINEVYLGYDLPATIIRRQNVFSRVNIYAQASNLGVIWSKSGMDPDYPVGSLNPMATYTFGLKLNF